jgi:hypothetical protein
VEIVGLQGRTVFTKIERKRGTQNMKSDNLCDLSGGKRRFVGADISASGAKYDWMHHVLCIAPNFKLQPQPQVIL